MTTVRPAKSNVATANTIPAACPHTVRAGAGAWFAVVDSGEPNADLYTAMVEGAPLSALLRLAASK